MHEKWFACLALTVLGAGCPSVEVDEGEGLPAPTIEFDPGNRIIPFPNNLLLDPATGKLNIPPGCNPNGGVETETAKALREQVLNQLDGFGTFKTTINITFTEAVDASSFEGRAHLYKIAENGMPVDPASSEAIALLPTPNETARFDASCENPQAVTQVTFVPIAVVNGMPVPIPLEGSSTYAFALTEGVKTANGADFQPSFVWALVRSVEDPVVQDDAGNVISDRTPLDPADPEDLATLQGIDLLWTVHEGPLQFLAAKGHAHETILIATSFNTQTVADPLDPTVATSPAAEAVATPPLAGVARINPAADGEAFLNAVLPPGSCAVLPCDAVGEALQAGLLTKNYQIDTPNPFDANTPIPGPWGDPIDPEVVREGAEAIVGTVISTPAAGCPAEGCPTVIFGHGLGSSKTTMFAIAAQLAAQGFNAVAIDWVAHDSRAVRISDDPARLCDGVRSPTTSPQCFAPFLSPNLAATRDNIRQSIVDLHALTASLKACGTENCGELQVDATKIVYMGISLGGILGGLGTATVPDIKAAVLNVPAVSWVDILENTETLAIRCLLVDGLIDAGILVGDKFNPAGPTGLCVGDEWKTQPGYRQFAVIGRWILDPADPVNFTPQLAAKTILIQEVVGDAVVPNVATEIEAALVQLPGMIADPATSATPAPSAAITTDPTASKFVRYPTLPPDAITGFPGNTFAHASLLQPPAGSGTAGQLGTIRLQTDAITFLSLNR